MSPKELILTEENGVRLIQINRPKTKNAFDSYVYKTITETLNNDSRNDNIVTTIITGIGEYYSSGFDIKSAMSKMGSEDSNDVDTVKAMIKAFITYPKLLIAVINGPAIGIAVTTAALCDIVYASDKATFTTPFINIGLCAEGCSSVTFPNILGRSKASEMLLLGKTMSAQEALAFNFVSQVIPHKQLDAFIQGLKRFGKLPVNSVKINKRLILDNIPARALCECNEKEVIQLAECFASEEFAQSIMKFLSRKSKL